MDQIEARLDDLRPGISIILVCQTGKRARMTAGLLEPCQRQISVLEGGTRAWIQAGLPVVTSVKNRWSLERQVRLGAGLLVLAGAVLAFTVDVNWLFLSAFVGLGLTFAGLTASAPWQKFSRRCRGMDEASTEFRQSKLSLRMASECGHSHAEWSVTEYQDGCGSRGFCGVGL